MAMKQFTFVADGYKSMSAGIAEIPKTFDNVGSSIYVGRNTVKSVMLDGVELIVKKFKPCNFFRSCGYLFRGSKAKRAYIYGNRILSAGIDTPAPVAYMELKSGPFVREAYFISLPNYAHDLIPTLRHAGFDCGDVTRLAGFVVSLHAKGILHGDLNLSNILWDGDHFILIDTNRTRFVAKPSRSQILENIIRLTHRRDLLRAVLAAYADIASLDSDEFIHGGLVRLLRLERRKRILHKIFRK